MDLIVRIAIFLARCLQLVSVTCLRKIHNRNLGMKIIFLIIGVGIGVLMAICLNEEHLNTPGIIVVLS